MLYVTFTHKIRGYKYNLQAASYLLLYLIFVFRLNYSDLFSVFSSGHIGITVDDTIKACERFERLGVEFVKKPDDGEATCLRSLSKDLVRIPIQYASIVLCLLSVSCDLKMKLLAKRNLCYRFSEKSSSKCLEYGCP